ncbi:MAG TPA: hypothetical protein VID72_04280, partial [Ktedonobacterales bacterium]
MSPDLNNAPTDPDVSPRQPGYPHMAPTAPYDPGATRQAGAPGQLPYVPTIPYPVPMLPLHGGGSYSAPTVPDPRIVQPVVARPHWPGFPGFADPTAITVASPPPVSVPAPRRP